MRPLPGKNLCRYWKHGRSANESAVYGRQKLSEAFGDLPEIGVPVSREEGYDVYILHSDFSEEECETFRQKFAGQEENRFHFLYVDPEFFHSFPEPAGYPKTIYYGILASFFLPDSLERILYLDPDTVIIRPMDELYGRDMEDRLFIACSHTRKLLSGINSLRLGMQENLPYINTK